MCTMEGNELAPYSGLFSIHNCYVLVERVVEQYSPVDKFIYYEFYRSGCMCDHVLFIQNRISKKLFCHKFCEEVTELPVVRNRM